MFTDRLRVAGLLSAAVMLMAGAACAPATPAAPTTAPAKPAPTSAPAKAAPTAAPAKAETKPAATTAPAKTAEKPAAKPTEKPAAKPETKAEPKPAAKASYDENAVADFYRGKTVRIVLGLPPGSGADLTARLVARHMPKYIPGNPNMIVENKPGAGGLLAANTVYAVEPKDGTVIGAILEGLVLQQALDAPGIEYDVTKYQWIGSLVKTQSACMARVDSGIASFQDVLGGKELIVATTGPGTTPHDTPAILNATLGSNFKLVSGYPGGSQSLQAVENKEVDGYCVSLSAMLTTATRLLEGDNPTARIIVTMGSRVPEHPLLKDAVAAEPLAKTDEARQLLRAVAAPGNMTRPFAVPPGVPADRVAALRDAFTKAMADKELLEEAAQAQVELDPSTGEEVTQTVQEMLGTPPETLAKLKDILK